MAVAIAVLFVRPAAAQPVVAVPVINSAIVNYTTKTLTASGANFGSNPKVTLGTTLLTIQSAAGVSATIYWSSTAFDITPSAAWYAHLGSGDVGGLGKGNPLHVWPVRGGPR